MLLKLNLSQSFCGTHALIGSIAVIKNGDRNAWWAWFLQQLLSLYCRTFLIGWKSYYTPPQVWCPEILSHLRRRWSCKLFPNHASPFPRPYCHNTIWLWFVNPNAYDAGVATLDTHLLVGSLVNAKPKKIAKSFNRVEIKKYMTPQTKKPGWFAVKTKVKKKKINVPLAH